MSSPHANSETPKIATAQKYMPLSSVRILAVALLCFGLITAAIYARATLKSSATPRQPLKVDTVSVQQQEQYTVTRWFSGRIEPRQRVLVASELAGKVTAVAFDEGDTIRKGEVVVILDTEILETEKAQLEAQLSGIDAELKLADLRLNRQNNLQKNGFSSDDTIDAIKTQITNLKSSRRTLVSRIDNVEIRLQKANIRAPFDARIQSRMVDEGAVINEGTPLIELLESAEIEVKVGVPVSVANTLNLGQELVIQAPSTERLAEVISIAPGVDFTTQTVAIRLRLISDPSQNASMALRFGEFVSLKFSSPVDNTGFWVSNTALIEGERGLWNLYSVDQNNIVRKHATNIVFNDNEKSFVNANIADNTRVIVTGSHRVTPGMKVDI